MKESTWILYSFDVKMDGKSACRLTDKKFQNHENTVDLAGTIQDPKTVEQLEQMLCEIWQECEDAINKKHNAEGADAKTCWGRSEGRGEARIEAGEREARVLQEEHRGQEEQGEGSDPAGR